MSFAKLGIFAESAGVPFRPADYGARLTMHMHAVMAAHVVKHAESDKDSYLTRLRLHIVA